MKRELAQQDACQVVPWHRENAGFQRVIWLAARSASKPQKRFARAQFTVGQIPRAT